MSTPDHSSSSQESLTGVLEKIIFSNAETNFFVGEITSEQTGQIHTITGTLPNLQCGETLVLEGNWQTHKQFGRQFKVEKFTSKLPSSVFGIRKYLGSGLVPGIGKKYAKKIVDTFGEQTLEVIEADSGRLREVEGIGPKRVKEIKAAWESQRATREVMLFLQTYGVGVKNCLRLVKRYGNQAKAVLMQDPYATAREIDGIGFKTADQIARNLGFGFDSAERVDAGVLHALKEKEQEGHTALPFEVFQDTASKLLEVDPTIVKERMRALVERQDLIYLSKGKLLQLPNQSRYETAIASSLNRICLSPSDLPSIKVEIAVRWAQERCGFTFAAEQENALRSGLTHRVSILTGGPGTGKTTILRSLVQILKAKKVSIHLASPTGRAAKRLSDSTRHRATTLHRLLKFDPKEGGFTMNEHHPLKCQFIIIDEASMLDSGLGSSLFKAIPSTAQVLLVGDVNQLPSVGAGNLLKDLIESKTVPVISLEQVFRQKEESNIVTTAHAILGGRTAPPKPVDSISKLLRHWDLQFIRAPSPEECLTAIVQLMQKWIPSNLPTYDIKSEVQVLAPMHRGTVGIQNLNTVLQNALNAKAKSVSFGGTIFSVGDRIIQMRNNYDKGLYNGDMGVISHVNPDAGTIAAEFDGNVHDFDRMEMTEIELAYAISIHKSQGSEFPIVVIPVLKQHFMLLQRNLLYTAITRGRKKVFVIGDPAAWAMAVSNVDQQKRFTGLPLLLKD